VSPRRLLGVGSHWRQRRAGGRQANPSAGPSYELVNPGPELVRRVSGFESLQSAGMPLNLLCVLFA
jgi:hypothetical protein